VDAVDPRLDAICNSLYRVAVKAVIIRDHKILLVKERDDEWWSLPGGGIDHGETPAEALIRELAEELGLAPADIKTDGRVILATAGAVVGGIPKANLFYRVNVAIEHIHPSTADVEKSGWFTATELATLYLSPSAGDVNSHLVGLLTEA